MKRLCLILSFAAIAAAQTAIPSYKQLVYPPLKQVVPPEPVEFTLSNGIRVFLLENHELPVLRGVAMVRTGNLFDPPDKRGLSQIMADVLRSGGTRAKTGEQIDEELENVAASVESGMGETSASVSFSGLKETEDQVLAVFKDVLTSPEFRQDKIDLSLNQYRGGILRRNDEAGEIPRRELLSLLYGRDNSYGWTIELEHLNNIRRDDLIAFYQRYYFPKNILLAVYGDFTATQMRAKLEQLFSSWTVQQPDVPPFPQVTAKPAPGVYLAEKDDVTQTFFSLGHLGGTLRDKDYPALEVAASILGEGFKSRLTSQIRTRLGYAYSIGATWSANYNHPGTFRIGGSTKSVSTVETLQAAKAEVEKMRTTEVTAVELSEARQSVLNSFVFFFDSPEKTLNRVLQYAYHGYPKDFLFQYQKAIEGVTRADVLRVAKQYWQPDQFTIVAVGNPKDMKTPLSTLGEVHEIDLTIPQPKPQVSASSEAGLAQGRDLLAKAQSAMGGTDKLLAVKDITVSGELKTPAEAGGITIQSLSQTILPSRIRIEQELPFGKMLLYSDGKTGWLSVQGATQPIPGEILEQVRGELFRQLPKLMLGTANAISANTVEISEDNQVVRVEFDPATGLPAKLTYREGGMESAEVLSDWRDVGGIKLPYRTALGSGGFTVTDYRINSGLNVADLEKRP